MGDSTEGTAHFPYEKDYYSTAVMMKSRMNSTATTQITGCTSLACFLQVLTMQ